MGKSFTGSEIYFTFVAFKMYDLMLYEVILEFLADLKEISYGIGSEMHVSGPKGNMESTDWLQNSFMITKSNIQLYLSSILSKLKMGQFVNKLFLKIQNSNHF